MEIYIYIFKFKKAKRPNLTRHMSYYQLFLDQRPCYISYHEKKMLFVKNVSISVDSVDN